MCETNLQAGLVSSIVSHKNNCPCEEDFNLEDRNLVNLVTKIFLLFL